MALLSFRPLFGLDFVCYSLFEASEKLVWQLEPLHLGQAHREVDVAYRWSVVNVADESEVRCSCQRELAGILRTDCSVTWKVRTLRQEQTKFKELLMSHLYSPSAGLVIALGLSSTWLRTR